MQLRVLFSFSFSLDLDWNTGCAIVGGFWRSMFPDLVEPPDHYTHRGFLHSLYLLKRLSILMLGGLLLTIFHPRFWFLFYASLAYVLHLMTDATTPMRLPGMTGFRRIELTRK